MLPTHAVEKFLERHKPGLQDIAWELRNLVAAAAPGVTEVARRDYLSYFFQERGGPVAAGVCGIGLRGDHVRLVFIHGALLPDPKGLLHGRTFPMRSVLIHSYDEADWEALRDLIAASARLDPRKLTAAEIDEARLRGPR